MTKTSGFMRKLASILCIALIAASALCITGCDNSSKNDDATSVPASSQSSSQEQVGSQAPAGNQDQNEAPDAADSPSGTFEDGATLGEGAVQFTFTVVDADGNETTATVNTDAASLGEALLNLGVIAGEDGDYGLYVKTVNGQTLDYDKDGKYWALYVGDQYATTGVDSTEIEAGATYSFKAEE